MIILIKLSPLLHFFPCPLSLLFTVSFSSLFSYSFSVLPFSYILQTSSFLISNTALISFLYPCSSPKSLFRCLKIVSNAYMLTYILAALYKTLLEWSYFYWSKHVKWKLEMRHGQNVMPPNFNLFIYCNFVRIMNVSNSSFFSTPWDPQLVQSAGSVDMWQLCNILENGCHWCDV